VPRAMPYQEDADPTRRTAGHRAIQAAGSFHVCVVGRGAAVSETCYWLSGVAVVMK
jgi:hypothetical protein